MKNQGNMTWPKGHNNFSVTNLKEMEIYDLSDKEFKIVLLRGGQWKTRKCKKNSSAVSGKQYKNKMRSLTKRNDEEEPNRNYLRIWELENTMNWN